MEEGPLTGTSSMAGLTTAQEQSPGTNGHKALLLGCTTSPKEHESNCSLALLSKIICPHMMKKERIIQPWKNQQKKVDHRCSIILIWLTLDYTRWKAMSVEIFQPRSTSLSFWCCCFPVSSIPRGRFAQNILGSVAVLRVHSPSAQELKTRAWRLRPAWAAQEPVPEQKGS